jgi:hypothetical protein
LLGLRRPDATDKKPCGFRAERRAELQARPVNRRRLASVVRSETVAVRNPAQILDKSPLSIRRVRIAPECIREYIADASSPGCHVQPPLRQYYRPVKLVTFNKRQLLQDVIAINDAPDGLASQRVIRLYNVKNMPEVLCADASETHRMRHHSPCGPRLRSCPHRRHVLRKLSQQR